MIRIQDGETALHRAALGGYIEVVKMLVDYGAAVDIRNKAYIATDLDVYYNNIIKYDVVLIVGWINCLGDSQRPRLPGSV